MLSFDRVEWSFGRSRRMPGEAHRQLSAANRPPPVISILIDALGLGPRRLRSSELGQPRALATEILLRCRASTAAHAIAAPMPDTNDGSGTVMVRVGGLG